MAKYDQGGGCPCGLQRVCDCESSKPLNKIEHVTLEEFKNYQESLDKIITGMIKTYEILFMKMAARIDTLEKKIVTLSDTGI